jgi:hypothetical protein
MFGANKFLNDFVKMRQNLHEDKKTDLGKKHTQPVSDASSLSIASIIEKKPPCKDVLKFFQKKISSIGYDSE